MVLYKHCMFSQYSTQQWLLTCRNEELYMWNVATSKSVYFSSVTETSLIERDSGEEWTASWNGTVLTLTDPDGGSYKLEWSGYSL